MGKAVDPVWQKLQTIYQNDLASHTGLEVGLSNDQLELSNPPNDLQAKPTVSEENLHLDPIIKEVLPDTGLPYPTLNEFVFGELPESWLTGTIKQAYVGFATEQEIRRSGASAGVLTQILLHLLETKQITGAIVSRFQTTKPYAPETVIARTANQIASASGSIYTESAPLTILNKLQQESGPLAFVGLPDHVAAIRMLQLKKHPTVKNIKYLFGPYTGTILKFQALQSYLKANGAKLEDVTQLSYRSGEWPGYLQINLKDGRALKAEKFYYNYLIPFFITKRSSQLAVDFTNELTDISVGDAWAPEYEKQGGGYSVILTRTIAGQEILNSMQSQNSIKLTPISNKKVIEMHAHMIDFKKRGTFIRMQIRALRGKGNPDFGYEPVHIPITRYFIEAIISGLFLIGSTNIARWIIEHLPLLVVGPVFNWLRLTWKNLSKGSKRKGLPAIQFRLKPSKER